MVIKLQILKEHFFLRLLWAKPVVLQLSHAYESPGIIFEMRLSRLHLWGSD